MLVLGVHVVGLVLLGLHGQEALDVEAPAGRVRVDDVIGDGGVDHVVNERAALVPSESVP